MPYYRITSILQQRGFARGPVLWFVPPNTPLRDDIEAPTARDAVLRLMAIDHVDIGPDAPVRGSPILHRWFFPRTVTVAAYVDEFLAHQRRFAYRTAQGPHRRVLSVEERPATSTHA